MHVGAQLLAIRQLYGWSQRELAKRAGVNNSTIAQIESGKVSPSVTSLEKVLEGVPMTLAEFFSFDIGNPPQHFFSLTEMPDVGRGEMEFRLLAANKRKRAISLLQKRYPPGSDSGPYMLSFVGEEGGFILEGELEVTVGAETRVLGPGEGYYFESRLPHRFRNQGSVDCVLISACTNEQPDWDEDAPAEA